jgi:hypothetical protein
MPIRVQTPNGLVEFPDGMSEEQMAAALTQLPKQESAPKGEPGEFAKYGPMSQLMRDQAYPEQAKQQFRDSAPTIGAGVATALTGGAGLIPTAIAAGGGGFLGARARGDSREDAAWEGGKQGALTAGAGAIGAGVAKAGEFITGRALPLVRSALKPAFSDLRKRAGIEGITPAALADRQSQFIIDQGLKTPEQAAALVKSSGAQVDDAIKAAESNPNVSPVLDTANRIPRYLSTVLRRVEKQVLPGKDRGAIQNVGREVVEDSPLSQYTSSTARPSPKRQDFNAKWDDTAKPARSWADGPAPEAGARPRALRANIKPSEGAEIVRTKSFYDKDASGGTIAGGKAVERAVRDSIKEAVPATRKPLMTQGRAMDAERLLDRSSWRDANRDSMPGGMGAIAGLANGRPVMGLLLHALKEGQFAAGMAAPKVGGAISRASGPVSQLDQLVRAAMLANLKSPTERPE